MTLPAWWAGIVETNVAFLGEDPIPLKFRGGELNQIPQAKLRELVRNYGRNFFDAAPKGIAPLLLGPMAAYKSFSAALLARQIREKALVKVDWVDCPVLLNAFERRRFDVETSERIEQIKNTGWLVMDDFAFVRLGTWQSDLMAEIACHRFDNSMPICWTGNVHMAVDEKAPLAILSEVVGGQLARRILEASQGYRLMVSHP